VSSRFCCRSIRICQLSFYSVVPVVSRIVRCVCIILLSLVVVVPFLVVVLSFVVVFCRSVSDVVSVSRRLNMFVNVMFLFRSVLKSFFLLVIRVPQFLIVASYCVVVCLFAPRFLSRFPSRSNF